jgi:hypothetical protein
VVKSLHLFVFYSHCLTVCCQAAACLHLFTSEDNHESVAPWTTDIHGFDNVILSPMDCVSGSG